MTRVNLNPGKIHDSCGKVYRGDFVKCVQSECVHVPDEQLGVSELHVADVQVAQQHHDGVLVGVAAEVGPRVLRQHLVALEEAVVALPGREAGATDSNVLY